MRKKIKSDATKTVFHGHTQFCTTTGKLTRPMKTDKLCYHHKFLIFICCKTIQIIIMIISKENDNTNSNLRSLKFAFPSGPTLHLETSFSAVSSLTTGIYIAKKDRQSFPTLQSLSSHLLRYDWGQP